MAKLEEEHRQKIEIKDSVIATRADAMSELEHNLDEVKHNLDSALDLASATDMSACRHRAKTEFLHRYVSSVEAPDSNMRQLFSNHVCLLWRETQRDILNISSNELMFQVVSRANVRPAAMDALASRGIDEDMISEHLTLNRNRVQIERRVARSAPQVEPFSIVDRTAQAQLQ